jgi:hypothetical protein
LTRTLWVTYRAVVVKGERLLAQQQVLEVDSVE